MVTPPSATRSGFFTVRWAGEKLHFEIPRTVLGEDILLVCKDVAGKGACLAPPRVVAFSRAGNRLLLRQRRYDIRADSGSPIQPAVHRKNVDLILAALDIEAFGPDSAMVVDVTRLVTSELFPSAMITVDGQRTFVDSVAAFPENVRVDVTVTGQVFSDPPETARVTWNFVKLPRPMRPRLYDGRIGLDGVCFVDFSRAERAERRGYVRRFRLEKKDPRQPVSDPVKPIVFWIDREMPEWVVPWVKRGVEAWAPAFREAGFSNAIIAKLAPTPEEDPEWALGDARYSVIRWSADTSTAGGDPTVVDPRSGEIVRADVSVAHNLMVLFGRWYFVQASPLDARARTFPLPDSLLGRLVEVTVTHEVGHAIGLPHNMKASSQYPVDSLRSAPFLRRMGFSPSVMDYVRFNYVAQPEDSLPPELLLPRVGPYDRFAIMWAYKEIPDARTPDEERATMDEWARMQHASPFLRYEVTDATADPGELTEAVGDADAVRASTLGMKNLRRVMASLLKTAEWPAQDYQLLKELYRHVLAQWDRYTWHVAALIGGVEADERYGTEARFAAVPAVRQREATRYLGEYAFRVPAMFLDTAVLRRMEQEGVVDRIRSLQDDLLRSLLSGRRLNRLLEYEALSGPRANPYAAAEFLVDLRRSVWSELTQPTPRVDIYRRNLQYAYLEAAQRTIEQPSDSTQADEPSDYAPEGSCAEHRSTTQKSADGPARFPGDARALLRGELLEIERSVRLALGRTKDDVTRQHWRDVDIEVGRILRR